MKKIILTITLIFLISGCTEKVDPLSTFLERSGDTEYKITYEESNQRTNETTEIFFYNKQKRFKLAYDLALLRESDKTLMTIIGTDNQVYICSEIMMGELSYNSCEILLNESQKSKVSNSVFMNPVFIQQKLKSQLFDYKIKFSGTKIIINKKVYCFNAVSDSLIIDICFTDFAIPLLIRETSKKDNKIVETKATSIELEVNDDEFVLPAELGVQPHYDPTYLDKAKRESIRRLKPDEQNFVFRFYDLNDKDYQLTLIDEEAFQTFVPNDIDLLIIDNYNYEVIKNFMEAKGYSVTMIVVPPKSTEFYDEYNLELSKKLRKDIGVASFVKIR